MLTTIHIAVRDRVPTITEGEDVISFNSDYVTEFDFDEEWQSNVKTVYFICEDGSYQAVVMSGNTCDVPMMAGEHRRIFVGVQEGTSEKPGVLKTTRPCCLKVADSIADYIGQPIPDPAPSVYEQIITMLENLTTPTWETVQNKPFSTLGDGLTVDEDGVLSAEGGGGSPNAVQYVAQELTDEQKAQARENIGAKAATEKSAYIISRTRSYGHISLYDMDFDGIYAQIQSGKVVMLLVNGATYYGGLSTAGSGKEIVFYNIVDISDSGGRDKGITYFGFTWRKGDNWLTEWRGDIPRVEVDSTLTNSGSAADAKAVGDELAKKQPKGDYLTTEIDPTVPPWAKSPTKPTYTAAEVGALPSDTVIPPAYTLPQATADALGGIKADAATDEDTQDVRIGADGKMKTKPYELTDADKTAVADEVVADGIAATLVDMPGGGVWELIGEQTLTEDVISCVFEVENYDHYEVMVALVNSTNNQSVRALEVRLNEQQGKSSTGSPNFIASSGTRSAWCSLVRRDGVWRGVMRSNLNGDGLIGGIVENMTTYQASAWYGDDKITKLTVSNLNRAVGWYLGTGTRIKVYGVK